MDLKPGGVGFTQRDMFFQVTYSEVISGYFLHKADVMLMQIPTVITDAGDEVKDIMYYITPK